MVRISKRLRESKKEFTKEKSFPLKDAIATIAKFPKVKFDETVELHILLNIDTKQSEQSVRGTIVLPHGTGNKVRVAVFCQGENIQKAVDCGAEHAGAQDLIEKVNKGFLDFDCIIATPDMMRDLSKLGKVLGPRGLMPSPKAGTVTQDIAKAIKEVKAGRIEFKSDKQAGIHVGFGKRSFSEQNLLENVTGLLEAIGHTRPASVKGDFLKSISISTTMGPGIKVVYEQQSG